MHVRIIGYQALVDYRTADPHQRCGLWLHHFGAGEQDRTSHIADWRNAPAVQEPGPSPSKADVVRDHKLAQR